MENGLVPTAGVLAAVHALASNLRSGKPGKKAAWQCVATKARWESFPARSTHPIQICPPLLDRYLRQSPYPTPERAESQGRQLCPNRRGASRNRPEGPAAAPRKLPNRTRGRRRPASRPPRFSPYRLEIRRSLRHRRPIAHRSRFRPAKTSRPSPFKRNRLRNRRSLRRRPMTHHSLFRPARAGPPSHFRRHRRSLRCRRPATQRTRFRSARASQRSRFPRTRLQSLRSLHRCCPTTQRSWSRRHLERRLPLRVSARSSPSQPAGICPNRQVGIRPSRPKEFCRANPT